MPIYKIPQSTAQKLIETDESGMGYQVIRHADDLLFVFNATVAISYENLFSDDISLNTLALFGGDPDVVALADIEPLEIDGDVQLAFSDFMPEVRMEGVSFRSSEIVAMPDPARYPGTRPEVYFRFNAYQRNRRVDPVTGSYASGTYATTFTDLPFSPSGYAAVGRFALPNPAPARYVFPIVTYNVPNLMGTATPNYGQTGGGVEVFFRAGASHKAGEGFRIAAG